MVVVQEHRGVDSLYVFHPFFSRREDEITKFLSPFELALVTFELRPDFRQVTGKVGCDQGGVFSCKYFPVSPRQHVH